MRADQIRSSERSDGSVLHTIIYVTCNCKTIPVVIPFRGGRCKRCGVRFEYADDE